MQQEAQLLLRQLALR